MAPPLPPGQVWINQLQDQGLSDENIEEMRTQRIQKALDNGVSQDEIDKYFGTQPSKLPEAVSKIVVDNVRQSGFNPQEMDTADPNSWSDLFSAGFGNSVLSLQYVGAPTKQLPPPEQMGWFGAFAGAAGQFLGDLPSSYSGGFFTGVATRNPTAAAYAFNAVPEALRQAYLEHYSTGAPITVTEFIRRVNNAGLAGVAGGKAGQLVGGALEPIAGPAIKKSGEVLASALAETTAAAGLEGRLPTAQDFAVGAMFAAAFPIAGKGVEVLYSAAAPSGRIDLTAAGEQLRGRMETIWAKTGIDPAEAGKVAAEDPYLRSTIMGKNADGEVITDPWLSHARPEGPKWGKPETPEQKAAVEAEAQAKKTEILGGIDEISKELKAEDPEAKPIRLTEPAPVVTPGRPKPRGPAPTNNYLRVLGDEAPVLHREMSPDAFMAMHQGDGPMGAARVFFADSPEMALGQGNNRGIRIQVGSSDLQGKLNRSKPGMDLMYEQRQAEWEVMAHNGQIANRIQKVTVDEDTWNKMKPREQNLLTRYLRAQEARGAIIEAPGYKTTPTPLKPASGLPDSGVPAVEALSPDQLSAVAGEPVDPKLAKNYVNEDGSVDLEAALIAHKEGDDAAKAFRANGRNTERLSPRTQRYLESRGNELIRSGAAAGDGGGGKKPPPPPPPPPSDGGDPKRIEGGRDPRFTRSPEIMMEVMNEKMAPRSYKSGWKDFWRVAKAGSWWRELAPATRFDKAFKVTENEAQIGLEDFLRLAYASSGRTKARLEYGGIKMEADVAGNPYYDVNRQVKPMKVIISEAAKLPSGGIERFRSYMQALDTVDRAALGLKTTNDLNDAVETIRSNDKSPQGKALKQLAKDWNDMNRDSLMGMVFSGRLTKEQVAAIEKRHPNWFTQKVSKEEVKDPRRVYGSSGASGGQVIQKSKGHELVIDDQFLATIELIDRREKFNSVNIARRFAVETMKRHFGGESTSRDVVITKPKKPVTDLATEDVAVKRGKIVDDDGNIFDDDGNQKLDDDAFFRPNDNEIHYWEDGKAKSYKVPEFPEEWGLDRTAFMEMIMSPSLVQQDFMKGVLAMTARGQRFMISATPKFVIRVLFQDAFQSAIMSKYGGIPLVNTFRGGIRLMDHFVNGSLEGPLGKAVTRYEMNGGYNMALVEMDSNKSLEFFNRLKTTGHYDVTLNGRSSFLAAAKEFLRSMDAVNRTALFTKAEKEMGTIKGAIESRMVHGDFAEKSSIANGATMNFIAAIQPFFRAKMRGFIDASIRQFSKDPTGVAIRGFSFVAVPSVLLTALNYWIDDQFEEEIPINARYSQIDRGERDVSFHLPYFNADGELVRIRAPAPFENGAIINGLTHRLFDSWRGEDPAAFRGFVSALVKKLVTSDIPILGNPVLTSIIESKTGVNTYSGRPLIPERIKHLSANNQVLPWSTEAAKGIAAGINAITGGDTISPVTVDAHIRHWGGDLGASLVNTLDRGTALIPFWQGINENEPAGGGENDPWFGSFILRNPGMNARAVQDFYDDYTEYQKRKNDLKAASRGDDEEAYNRAYDRMPLINLDGTAKALGRLRTAIYGISADKTMSSSDKQQLIDQLADQMIGIAEIKSTMWRSSLEDIDAD